MEPSAFDETFGVMPNRPDHVDFDRLAELVLAHDARSDEDRQSIETQMLRTVDPDSASYMALQRAFRVAGVTTRTELTQKRELVTQLATAWIDGFVIGAAFRR